MLPTMRRLWQGMCLLGVVWALGIGCASDGALHRFSPAEQEEFFIYRKVMTWAQERTYRAKTTASARTAYLQEIGLAQRFQALESRDQDAMRHGFPLPGMSAEALRFLWGEPYYTAGEAHRSAHWYYLGSSLALAERGNQDHSFGNRVDIYLLDGRVVGWVDYAPSDDGSDRRHLW